MLFFTFKSNLLKYYPQSDKDELFKDFYYPFAIIVYGKKLWIVLLVVDSITSNKIVKN